MRIFLLQDKPWVEQFGWDGGTIHFRAPVDLQPFPNERDDDIRKLRQNLQDRPSDCLISISPYYMNPHIGFKCSHHLSRAIMETFGKEIIIGGELILSSSDNLFDESSIRIQTGGTVIKTYYDEMSQGHPSFKQFSKFLTKRPLWIIATVWISTDPADFPSPEVTLNSICETTAPPRPDLQLLPQLVRITTGRAALESTFLNLQSELDLQMATNSSLEDQLRQSTETSQKRIQELEMECEEHDMEIEKLTTKIQVMESDFQLTSENNNVEWQALMDEKNQEIENLQILLVSARKDSGCAKQLESKFESGQLESRSFPDTDSGKIASPNLINQLVVGSTDCSYHQVQKVLLARETSSFVSKHWENLARDLGASEDDINNMRQKFLTETGKLGDAIIAVLETWRMQEGRENATLGKLMEHLEKLRWRDVIGGLRKEFAAREKTFV